MRKKVAIFGTILIAAILIFSGSAVATWVWVTWIDEDNTTNPDYINGAPDSNAATIGESSPDILGWIICDLGSSNVMPNSQNFSVFGYSTEPEDYTVWVSETHLRFEDYVGSGTDDTTEIFTTPSTGGDSWRYILICGTSGYITLTDPIYGPEIDAVGWDKP